LLEGARKMEGGVLAIAPEILAVSARDAARRVGKALARGVVARPFDETADSPEDVVGDPVVAVVGCSHAHPLAVLRRVTQVLEAARAAAPRAGARRSRCRRRAFRR